jgi:hypothetical protein
MPTLLPANFLLGEAMLFETRDSYNNFLPETYNLTNFYFSGAQPNVLDDFYNVGTASPRPIKYISIGGSFFIALWLPHATAENELYVSYGAINITTNTFVFFQVGETIPDPWKEAYANWVFNGNFPSSGGIVGVKELNFQAVGTATNSTPIDSTIEFRATSPGVGSGGAGGNQSAA